MLKIREMRDNLFLIDQGRSRGILLRKGFRDKAMTIKAKARVNHPKVGDTSRLPANQGREHFLLPPTWTLETRLPLEERILELWDTLVLVISGTFTYSVFSSLPHRGLGEPVLVLGCYIGPYYFTIRPDGPGHGLRSRSRTGLTMPRLQGPRGMSTPSHHKLSL